MWMPRVESVGTETLRYSAYVLCVIQGLSPPEVIPPPTKNLDIVYSYLAQQVWLLLQNSAPVMLDTYFGLIDPKYHEIARPTGMEIIEGPAENIKSVGRIHIVLLEEKIFEICAVIRNKGDDLRYFHRLIKQPCYSIRDRLNQYARHGIPPIHRLADSLFDMTLALEVFMETNPCDHYYIGQYEIFSLVATRFQSKMSLRPEMSWELKPSSAAFFFALKIKNWPATQQYHRCPPCCHELYDPKYVEKICDRSTNAHYYKYWSGSDCSHFEVNFELLKTFTPTMIRSEDGEYEEVDRPFSVDLDESQS